MSKAVGVVGVTRVQRPAGGAGARIRRTGKGRAIRLEETRENGQIASRVFVCMLEYVIGTS